MQEMKYLGICGIVLIIMMYSYFIVEEITRYNAESQKVDELEKQNYCYKVLYNEDIIGNDCDKYFQDDEWYKEYKQAEKVEK